MTPSRILIGTSGFSYDDWKGRWYPPDLSRARMFDAYAAVFDALEINVTYYRTPPPGSAESFVERAAGRVVFAVKAPGDITHKRLVTSEVVKPFQWFLEPFRNAGCLGAVLLQFPNAFRDKPDAWDHLVRCREALEGMPLVVEMRHESWDREDTDARLGELGFSRAAVDQPALKGLSRPGRFVRTGTIAYFRFHGRNEAQWYSHDEGADRYRYRYRSIELEPWVPIVREAAEQAESAYAFFNNHPEGAAPSNAEEFAGLLGISLRGEGYRDLFSG